jgi:phage-related minor tail protein
MKHLATIQSEFLKQARSWDDLSIEEQREYLNEHRKSKKRLTAGPKKPDFWLWIRGKKFRDSVTHKETPFILLPTDQKAAIRKQYDDEEEKRIQQTKEKFEEDQKLRQENEEKRKENAKSPSHRDYKWTQSRLQKLTKLFGDDAKRDLGKQAFEDSVHDLAQGFLYDHPGVKTYLKREGIEEPYQLEYIADMIYN